MRFRTRLVICVVALLSLFFGTGGGLLIYFSHNAALETELQNSIESYSMTVAALAVVNSAGSRGGYEDITNALKRMDTGGDSAWSGVSLTGSNSSEIYKSSNADIPYSDNSSIADSNATQEGDSSSVSDKCVASVVKNASGKRYLRLSGSISSWSERLVFDSYYDISSVYAERDRQIRTYYGVFLAVMVVGVAAAYVMSNALTAPITELSGAAKRIAEGDLSFRANASRHDEIGVLASDFNKMADKVEEKIEEMEFTMKSREEFMGSFAHEMKTPMTSIIGYADLLRSQTLSDEEEKEAANYIFSESKRLENLSLKLLEILVLRRGEEIELSPARPAYIAAQVVRLMKPQLKKRGITLQARCEDGVCLLEPDLVKSLMINIVDNARKAMDGSGNIFITTKMLKNGCRITVTDTGRGMEKDQLGRITEAFYRVDKSRSRAQGGAGLGLALCSDIVALHNGTIGFESEPGRGTRVTIDLLAGRGGKQYDE